MPHSLPAVSIIVPTLNEARRIESLAAALEAQQYEGEWEVLIVDGGSTDATVEKLKPFKRLNVMAAPKGVSRQRNAGAKAARGELLVFMDADNRPAPDFIARVARSYRRLPFAVACPWFRALDSSFAGRAIYSGFNVLFWLGQSTVRMGSGVCLIVPSRKFERIGGFDETMHLGEDIQLLRRLAPRYGLHRHLWLPLETSARRFEHEGAARLLWFYARITPLILFSRWKALQRVPYPAAPYESKPVREDV